MSDGGKKFRVSQKGRFLAGRLVALIEMPGEHPRCTCGVGNVLKANHTAACPFGVSMRADLDACAEAIGLSDVSEDDKPYEAVLFLLAACDVLGQINRGTK